MALHLSRYSSKSSMINAIFCCLYMRSTTYVQIPIFWRLLDHKIKAHTQFLAAASLIISENTHIKVHMPFVASCQTVSLSRRLHAILKIVLFSTWIAFIIQLLDQNAEKERDEDWGYQERKRSTWLSNTFSFCSF